MFTVALAALEFGLQYYDVYLKEGADNDQM
jgi:hypothetical protein